ncbi:DNA internalization-related competence protein ComEC/Rec2 [Cocleimonas sp. KMM 6892]|uniref:DNA internalization-related competence protein ComEC/Rec2 n=1 Tax=unclassified Cocleimonas TaxID=2639732 RepID=UPI002DBBBAC5|nr:MULTISPECIES: DNA internalization-related competence protein ComEC/Rec2 [unclassified Cocleimonas]MEB8431841.1 DNA internalization-related competence protein ComEC/Rec2 [Cocleimonas sp. KMM 6892]MEC4715073.1 DNA internalization-related competence protein ComEC/Rec2 [Cocleimonas sp. KMM 6895]MEC4744113.1 DNA internalization-related competence protein ComEC/Rec2 [Cocleimonas sp. KMM 6896]
MRIYSILFLLGTVTLQFFQTIPNSLVSISTFLYVLLPMSLALIIVLLLPYFKGYKSFNQNKYTHSLITALKSVIVFLFGFSIAAYAAHTQINNRLPSQLQGQEILLQGKIHDIPNSTDEGVRFIFKVENAELINNTAKLNDSEATSQTIVQKNINTPLDFKGNVRLGWFRHHQLLNAGEKWQFVVRLKQPNGFLNPGGFDYEKWLFTERIRATGYVRKSLTLNKRIAPSAWYSINRLRQNIHETIQSNVENKTSAAVLSALTVAVRTKLDDRQWELLQQSGTSHLIAISGLHIALLASFAFLPIMLLWRLFPRLNEWVPVRIAGSIVGVVFALIYAMLAGFTLPTQRALLMVVIGVWGLNSRKNYDSSTVLAVALILVLLLDPLAAMTISFWLSFMAVAIILFFIKRQQQKPRWMMVKLQLLISLAMLPLTILFFGTASLTSPVANLFAIPWVSLVVVPLSLVALILMPISGVLSGTLFKIAAVAIDYLFKGLELVDGTILSNFHPSEIPTVYLTLSFMGLLFIFLPKGFPARWLGAVLIIPAVLFSPAKTSDGEFSYTMLDVGQGMASVIQTKSHTLVYDTGARASNNFDIGKLVVIPYLRAKGITKVDTLLISHEDIDHRGGAKYIYDNIPVSSVVSSDPTVLDKVKIDACEMGKKWRWDNVDFEILSPPAVYPENDNNRSCVLRVSNAYHTLLITGDIQQLAENNLLETVPQKLHADVMTVPHHGSKTSSSIAFIEAVSPDIALITAGYRSRFGHPKAEIEKRYQSRGVALMNTVDHGAMLISFPANEGEIKTNSYRLTNRGFWSR